MAKRDKRGQNKAKVGKQTGIEKYLKFPSGSFDHIPHYARDVAIRAIKKVMRRERSRLFRQGLYYIVLADLCRSTEASAVLGVEANKQRVETFILSCIEALGWSSARNYFLPVREIGDAVLILFSSFEDAYDWWGDANAAIHSRNALWCSSLKPKLRKHFSIEFKTVVHLGEVAYSDQTIPMAQAVNEVFKFEKKFGAGEFGLTEPSLRSASPLLPGIGLRPQYIGKATAPGSTPTKLYRLI